MGQTHNISHLPRADRVSPTVLDPKAGKAESHLFHLFLFFSIHSPQPPMDHKKRTVKTNENTTSEQLINGWYNVVPLVQKVELEKTTRQWPTTPLAILKRILWGTRTWGSMPWDTQRLSSVAQRLFFASGTRGSTGRGGVAGHGGLMKAPPWR